MSCSVDECNASALDDSDYCDKHKPQDDDDECFICFEGDGEEKLFTLTCSHKTHLECVKGMKSMLCPYCEQEMTNLPQNLQDKIKANSIENKKRIEEEERREIMETMQTQNNANMVETTLRIGTSFLINEGIPVEFIPSVVEFGTTQYGGPLYSNQILHSLFAAVTNNMAHHLGELSEEDFEESSEEKVNDE